jgi:putative DNA primase/helicase
MTTGADQVMTAFDAAELLDGEDVTPQDMPPPQQMPPPPPSIDAELAALPLNDTGNGQRMLRRFGDRILFVRDVGPYVWTGKMWDGDGGADHARVLGQETAAAIASEARAIYLGGPRPDENEAAWQKRVARHHGFGVSSGNSGRIAAMIEQAQPHKTVPPDQLDADPMLINCQNGTLECKLVDHGDGRVASVELREHRREDLCSKAVATDYQPDADWPALRAFLARVQPDESIRRFLQVWAGYSLTGLTSEQKLVFFSGHGANGKSTFVDLSARLMDGYAASLRFESLAGDGSRRGDSATPDLARLPGVRLLRAAEPEANMRLKEAEVKAITGGEPLLVRHLHGRFFEMRPVFKLVLSGNHKPDIRGLDEGIWRRILLVPWDVSIPLLERDKGLAAKLWDERAGVFNWMLDGLRIYLEEGLVVPEAVVAATASYRDDSDPVGAFLRDSTEADPGGAGVTARDLFRAYAGWCEVNAVRAWSEKAFAGAMGQKSIPKSTDRVRRYLEIRLRPDAPRGPDDTTPHPSVADENVL